MGCALDYLVILDERGRYRAQQVMYLKAVQAKSLQAKFKPSKPQQTQKLQPMQIACVAYILLLVALTLGGLLSGLGILNTVMAPIVAHLRSQRAIVLATLLTGISANFLVGEQYLSTILPGQLFKESFKTVKLSPLALGRTIEDSGTVMNYLVPWGVAGAFAAQTLGVPVVQFAPYTLFALLSPIMSILSAITGIGLKQREL